MTYDKPQLKNLLLKNEVTITFKKKDGTERTMLCTLKPDVLPVVEKKEEETEKVERKQSLESIAVWDIEKKAWRSFRIDSIISLDGN